MSDKEIFSKIKNIQYNNIKKAFENNTPLTPSTTSTPSTFYYDLIQKLDIVRIDLNEYLNDELESKINQHFELNGGMITRSQKKQSNDDDDNDDIKELKNRMKPIKKNLEQTKENLKKASEKFQQQKDYIDLLNRSIDLLSVFEIK